MTDNAPEEIRHLGLPLRVENALQWGGITTVPQLTDRSHGQLLRLKSMGHAGIKEIERALAQYGLRLRVAQRAQPGVLVSFQKQAARMDAVAIELVRSGQISPNSVASVAIRIIQEIDKGAASD